MLQLLYLLFFAPVFFQSADYIKSIRGRGFRHSEVHHRPCSRLGFTPYPSTQPTDKGPHISQPHTVPRHILLARSPKNLKDLLAVDVVDAHPVIRHVEEVLAPLVAAGYSDFPMVKPSAKAWKSRKSFSPR